MNVTPTDGWKPADHSVALSDPELRATLGADGRDLGLLKSLETILKAYEKYQAAKGQGTGTGSCTFDSAAIRTWLQDAKRNSPQHAAMAADFASLESELAADTAAAGAQVDTRDVGQLANSMTPTGEVIDLKKLGLPHPAEYYSNEVEKLERCAYDLEKSRQARPPSPARHSQTGKASK